MADVGVRIEAGTFFRNECFQLQLSQRVDILGVVLELENLVVDELKV